MKQQNIRKFLTIFILLVLSAAPQLTAQVWTSPKYEYSVEVPEGFTKTSSVVGQNVDFKATNGTSSIVVVVKALPHEYAQYSIWEIMGDLTTYGDDWEYGAREYMDNPQFLKYGKTIIDGEEAFWYDYTTDSPKRYSKVYQSQKGRYIYTFTLTSPSGDYSNYSSVWFRFKDQINIK